MSPYNRALPEGAEGSLQDPAEHLRQTGPSPGHSARAAMGEEGSSMGHPIGTVIVVEKYRAKVHV